ncbi:thiamine-binding protein [Flexivirga sp. B27]
MDVRAEVTTEPFQGEGELPSHVRAVADALRSGGLEPDLGPLGTSVSGAADTVLPALSAALHDALAVGATRVSLQIEQIDE